MHHELAWERTILSCMLALAKFRVKRPYYGLVHARAPHKRWQEHWRAILQHGSALATEKELKYSCMDHNVNAAKWHFLPYITCGQVIPILKLKALEDRIIKKFPNSLNRIAYPRALYTSVHDGTRAWHVHAKKRDNGKTSVSVCRLQSGPVVLMATHGSDTI